ncbi:MAG: PAS domain S-box protein [Planctomycetota bacterium]
MPEQSDHEVRHPQWKHVVQRWTPAFWLGLAIVGAGALCVALSHQSTLVVRGMALQGTELQIKSVSAFRQMYSTEVAAKARLNGLEVTHDYKDKPGAIPLPATLTKALGEEITHKRPGAHIRLYSDYPYPWRAPIDRKDVFSAEALRALRHNPDQPFYRFEPFEGRPSLRYAIADRMSQSCVDCHNNRPDSPKRDWKAGDVRGVLEFIRPLDNEGPIAVLSARGTFQAYLMIAFGMVGLGLLGLLWSVRALRQSGESANSAHRAAKAALRETEALRNTLDEHAIVLVTDTKGSIIHVNDLFCRISGYSREELLGSNPRIINSGHHPKAVWVEMWKALAAGRTVQGERCNKAKDGRLYWVEVTITPWKNQDGTIEKYVSIQTDITERKQAEQRLIEAEERTRLIISTAVDAVVAMDNKGVVIDWNAQAEVTFGWTRDEAVGRPMHELIIPERLRAKHLEGMARYLSTGKARVAGQRIEVPAIRKDGVEITIELAITPVQPASGASGPICFSAFLRDVTQLRRTEAKLIQRQRRAQMLFEIGAVANQVGSVEESTAYCLKAVCAETGCSVGHVLTVGPDGVLTSAKLWHFAESKQKHKTGSGVDEKKTAGAYSEFQVESERLRFPVGVGMPGLVLKTGRPTWIMNTQNDKNFLRTEACRSMNLRGAFAFPVSAAGQIVAVLEFFHTEQMEPDPDLLLLVQALGREIGGMMERTRTQRALSQFKNTLDQTLDCVFMFNASDFQFTYVNKGAAQQVGYTESELLGMTPLDIKPEFTAERFREMVQPLLDGTQATHTFETNHRHKDGHDIPVEVSLQCVRSVDQASCFVAIVRDITERKQLEQSSRDSEQFLRSAIDSLDSHTVVLGSDAQILSVNRAWREFALANNGTGPGLLEGANYLEPCDKAALKCPEAAQVAAAVRLVLAGEAEPPPIEYACHAPTGQQWFLCSIRGFSREERRFAVVSHLNITAVKAAEGRLLAEVSEREHLQSQLVHAQKLESIGQLAAGIAHEINTPTQFISDNVRFLRDSQLSLLGLVDMVVHQLDDKAPARSWSDRSEEIRQSLKDLDFEFVREEIPKAIEQSLEGLERVATLVRAMKDFSHPGSENKTPADINKAIESTVTVCRNRWKYAADLELKLEQDLPLVPCRVAEMNQVILNLIVNAADAIMEKHGEGTKGLIRVSTCASGDSVELRVQDNGGGIPEALRNRIFDPFFTTKEVGKGTGQGLAISRDVVVNKHGGSLDVESTSGVGTTFVIRLPVHDTTEVPKGAEAEADE